ncbi:hypothetical protein RRG08_055537 [Elysia crispata]|uniref:Uncharacterized protein n=1 Tax=Elysia crispata TaxID=231223 RepID=A0AAE1AED9_9GAST|nr:hypothetical protein RRG08_055537 [Elysia crispata]
MRMCLKKKCASKNLEGGAVESERRLGRREEHQTFLASTRRALEITPVWYRETLILSISNLPSLGLLIYWSSASVAMSWCPNSSPNLAGNKGEIILLYNTLSSEADSLDLSIPPGLYCTLPGSDSSETRDRLTSRDWRDMGLMTGVGQEIKDGADLSVWASRVTLRPSIG